MKKILPVVAAALLCLSFSGPVKAEPTSPEWTPIDNPETHKGLVLEPRLMHWRDKLFLFWAGTSEAALNPEVYYTSREKKDTSWNKTKAPFFGQDVGNVRHIAIATARDLMAVIFQHRGNQGDRAVEVMMASSRDNGYSFTHPLVVDSYVLGETGGSTVAIGARQGAQRPEFAATWIAENGVLRAANIDPRSSFRPVAQVVGNVKEQDTTVQVVGNGGDGFYVVWPEGGALKSAHIKPLTGNAEDTKEILKGSFKKNFSCCSNYHGPAYLVADNEGGTELNAMVEKGGKFTPLGETVHSPLAGRNLQSRSSVDETNNRLHVAMLDSKDINKLYYMSTRDGKWSAPELVLDLDPSIPVTGFDICATDDTVWITASQGQLLFIRKRKIK